MTRILDASSPDSLEKAARHLQQGELVAFPTETVYGLGALGLSPEAVQKIFAAKRRPATNPLILHVAELDQARALSSDWPTTADALAEAFWPGPLTLVVPRASHVPDVVTAGLPSVAVRIPAHPTAHALLARVGAPVAAPSANRYTQVSPTEALHVARGLGDDVSLILDAGPTTVGLESTVVSLVEDPPVILRPGMIRLEQLRAILPNLRHREEALDDHVVRPSPGLCRRHYAPRATLRLLDAPTRTLRSESGSGRVGLLTCGVVSRAELDPELVLLELPADPQVYASGLYRALHHFDEQGCALVWIEPPPESEPWRAIRDRLARALD